RTAPSAPSAPSARAGRPVGGSTTASPGMSADGSAVPVVRILRARGVPAGIFTSLAVLSTTDVLTAYLPVVGEERGIAPGMVGILLSLRAAASVLSRLALPPMTAWLGRQMLLVVSCVVAGVVCALLAVPLPVWALALALVVLGFGLGVGQPLTMSTVVQASPERARSTALALRLTGNRLGQVGAPAGAGLLAGAAGAAAPFVLLGALLLGASVAAAGSRARARTDEKAGTGSGRGTGAEAVREGAPEEEPEAEAQPRGRPARGLKPGRPDEPVTHVSHGT
ncbi:MAG TPA: MFS transporter, partial [Streptomyces sp.]|nr:MFS transporter [Streptomyces sp.]